MELASIIATIIGYIFLSVFISILISTIISYIFFEIYKRKIYIFEEKKFSEKELKEVSNDMLDLIKCKTISTKENVFHEEFLKLHQVLKSKFPLVFSKCDIKIFDDSLLIKYKGKIDKKPLILMGHQDVVEANKMGWEVDPFVGKYENSLIYGRGAMDCKCNVYSILKAFEMLLKENYIPNYDLYFASSNNEEISGSGASKIVDYLKNNDIKPYLVIDEGGAILTGINKIIKNDLAFIGIYEKGYVDIKCTIQGKGGHSSQPPKNDPIYIMSKFINKIHKKDRRLFKMKITKEFKSMLKSASFSMPWYIRFFVANLWLFSPILKLLIIKEGSIKALLGTTCCFTKISGGEANNIIPKEVVANCNMRVSIFQNIEKSTKKFIKIANKYKIKTEITQSREASNVTKVNSFGYKFIKDLIIKNFSNTNPVPYIMLGGTDARFYSNFADNVIRFAPFRMTVPAMKSMHSINEVIKDTSICEGINFYKQIILNYNAM